MCRAKWKIEKRDAVIWNGIRPSFGFWKNYAQKLLNFLS